MYIKKIIKKIVYPILVSFGFLIFKKRGIINYKDINSILVVNLGLLGDCLLISPLISNLVNNYGDNIKINVLVTPWSYPSIKNNDKVKKIIFEAFWADPTDNHKHKIRLSHIIKLIKIIKLLRKEKFDLVINTWFTDTPLTAILLR